jgi:hypothetical protein
MDNSFRGSLADETSSQDRDGNPDVDWPECELVAKLATDKAKRELYLRLAIAS